MGRRRRRGGRCAARAERHDDHHYAGGASLALAIGFGAAALIGAGAALVGHAVERQLELYERNFGLELDTRARLVSALRVLERELENLRIAVTTNDEIREVYEFIAEPERDA